MSAYLSRLVQRFSPPAEDRGAALQPFVRSRSPIAAIDQRLGVDESLGHGFGEVGGAFDEPLADSPGDSAAPMRVQRKAASASVAGASLSAPAPVATSSAANVSALPPSPAPSSVEGGDAPAADLSPRREPMDPGRLFAPFALHYDDPAHARDPVIAQRPAAPSKVELRTIERIVEGRESTLAPSSPAFQPSAPAPTPSEASPITPPHSRAANVPWVVFDRHNPVDPEAPDFFEIPQLEPRPITTTTTQTELKVVPLVVEPRQLAPAPFVPASEPREAATQSSAPTTTRERAEAAPKPKPAPRAPASPTPARGKLDIESISQIGPLARHFPNRRRFRLRYR
ncbi:MAG: hypothetical protein R6X02_00665 [Enhygromyxa sp.]